jgi:c-di-GMP-binding flagellar brake protein YcgR
MGSDPDYVYWAQLPFAVIGTCLMAADWFCQVAPIMLEVAVAEFRSRRNPRLDGKAPAYCDGAIHPAVLRRLQRRRAYRDSLLIDQADAVLRKKK